MNITIHKISSSQITIKTCIGDCTCTIIQYIDGLEAFNEEAADMEVLIASDKADCVVSEVINHDIERVENQGNERINNHRKGYIRLFVGSNIFQNESNIELAQLRLQEELSVLIRIHWNRVNTSIGF